MPDVQEAIKAVGHDSFYVSELGVKNLAVYSPNQIKSIFNNGDWATDNDDISFSRKDYTKQYDDLDPKTRAIALAKGHVTPPTIKDRLQGLLPNFRVRMVQATFDRFRSVKDLSLKAYTMLRMSNGPQDGAVSVLLHYGQVFNDGGALNIKKGTSGLLDILKPVGGEVDRFLLWIAANRADNLSKEERENLLLARRDQGTQGTGQKHNGRWSLALRCDRETLRPMNELNRSVLDVARDTGLINDAAYKKFLLTFGTSRSIVRWTRMDRCRLHRLRPQPFVSTCPETQRQRASAQRSDGKRADELVAHSVCLDEEPSRSGNSDDCITDG
jgi:hypothetical protein